MDICFWSLSQKKPTRGSTGWVFVGLLEKVDRFMRGMRLSEEESRGVKIEEDSVVKGKAKEEQAVGKLLATKPAIPQAIENALGPMWCPFKGINCKEVGENIFLFTFFQAGGRKKAVDSGPWIFDKDLLVLEEFDPNKTMEDYSFAVIPIWIRVYKMPLGMMSRKNGVLIGDRVGEFMEMDGVEDGMAMGKYLRIKVRLDITVPLMRGRTMEVDDGGVLFGVFLSTNFCLISAMFVGQLGMWRGSAISS
jgi:hypothetical protein